MALVAALPEEAAAGERLEVSLRVGALYGCYPGYQYVNGPEDDIIPTGFTADYSVGVDLSANRDRELFAEDNGVREISCGEAALFPIMISATKRNADPYGAHGFLMVHRRKIKS